MKATAFVHGPGVQPGVNEELISGTCHFGRNVGFSRCAVTTPPPAHDSSTLSSHHRGVATVCDWFLTLINRGGGQMAAVSSFCLGCTVGTIRMDILDNVVPCRSSTDRSASFRRSATT